MRNISVFVLAFALLVGVASCFNTNKMEETASLVKVGDPVPQMTVEFVDGKRLSTNSMRGRVTVITFFDTRCGDCQRFLPSLDSLYRTMKDEMEFLTIAREQTAAQVAPYWDSKGYALPYAAPGHRGLYHLFATRIIPRVYIISTEGRISAMFDDANAPTMAEMRRVAMTKVR